MKKLFLLIICNVSVFFCYSQNLLLNEGSITFPEGAEKISKNEALNHVDQNMKHDKMVYEFISDEKSEIYKINNILLTFHSENGSFKENLLSNNKESLDWSARKDLSYKSDLKNINGNTVLTIYKTRGEIGYYYFFTINAMHSKSISGALYFNKSNTDKATVVLNHIISHLHFKE